MPVHTLVLLAATLLVALTTGLVYAFAVVVMPGLATRPDKEFLAGFKAIDRIIQDNAPLFLLVWVGGIVLFIAAVVLNAGALVGADRWLLFASAATYLLGVQLPTFVMNVPLNNRLQAVDLESLDRAGLTSEREAFEAPWIFWNWFRTVSGAMTTAGLLWIVV
jgi:uncharacterized membrane protein